MANVPCPRNEELESLINFMMSEWSDVKAVQELRRAFVADSPVLGARLDFAMRAIGACDSHEQHEALVHHLRRYYDAVQRGEQTHD